MGRIAENKRKWEREEGKGKRGRRLKKKRQGDWLRCDSVVDPDPYRIGRSPETTTGQARQ